MAIYSLGIVTTSTTSMAAFWEAIAGSADRCAVLEIGLQLRATMQSNIELARPTAMGITPTSPVTVLAENPSDPTGKTQVAVAWATAPTWSTALKNNRMHSDVKCGLLWLFPKGLIIPASSSLVMGWTGNAVATTVNLVVDE